MRTTVKIPPPHSDIQRTVYTFLAAKNGPQFLWLACGTKFGKTWSGASAMALAVPHFPNSKLRWVAPIYKQTMYGVDYLKQILPAKPYTSFKKADMRMDIHYNKSDIEFWHGLHPEDMEGARVAAQVNDEAAKLKKQVFDSCSTTWTMTRARVVNMSTPRGKNWFYKGCMRAKEEMLRAKRENRIPKEVFLAAPTRANPYVPQESIDEAKRLLPIRLYDQYYNAVFVDDDTVFGPLIIDPDLTGGQEVIQETDRIIWTAPNPEKRTIVAGQDWAKSTDFSVTCCIDINTFPFKVVGYMMLPQGMRYTHQVREIAKFLYRFQSCEILYHDKTGVGDALDDLLDAVPNLAYKGIVFSNASKALMVGNMITGTEKQEIHFPNIPIMLDEMKEFEVQTNDIGSMFYSHPEGDGNHDDWVTANFLAYAAALEHSPDSFEVRFLEDLKLPQKTEWENYIEDQIDIDIDEGF